MRVFPVCGTGIRIPWGVAEVAYKQYVNRYGNQQALEGIARRGGFYKEELDELLPGWRDLVLADDERR